MSIQRSKLNIGRARRRVQIRSALLLTLASCVVVTLARMLPGLFGEMPYALRWLLECAATLVAFGGGAYLGLCRLDGDHRKLVPMRRLSRAQMLWLSMLGVLAVGPALLAHEMIMALQGQRELAGQAMLDSARFLPMFVKSVMLVPVCEELFFRGYLLPALRPYGGIRAAAVVSLCFALVHASGGWAAHLLLSLLLCLVTLHTQSLLAPVLVHGCYNLTLILLESLGLSGLVFGWSLVSCAVRLALCAAFVYALRRAYVARPAGGAFALWEGEGLTRRELALVIAAAAMLIVSMILGG